MPARSTFPDPAAGVDEGQPVTVPVVEVVVFVVVLVVAFVVVVAVVAPPGRHCEYLFNKSIA